MIIPCYNAMRFLPQAVDSVLAQTYQDFEIILVNDGSTDKIEQWASTLEDSRIHFVSQVNQGTAIARNTGLKHAVGEYIAFLDADDLWHPLKLEKQVDALAENPDVGFVYTWVLLIDKQGKPLDKLWKISYEGNVWTRLIEGNIIACGSVPMIRRACIETVGLFEKFSFGCEDWDFWLRVSAHVSFKVVREVLAYYREVPGSISRSRKGKLSERLRKMEESYQHLIERAFVLAPEHLKYLEGRSHALANLRIAWEALKSPDADYQYVDFYRARARSYYPQIASLSEYKKLSRAVVFIRLFGVQSYERLNKRLKQMFRQHSRLSLVVSEDVG